MNYDNLLKNYTEFYNLHSEKIKKAYECTLINPSSKLLDVVESLRENVIPFFDNLDWDDYIAQIFHDVITSCKKNLEQIENSIVDNFMKAEEIYKIIDTDLDELKIAIDNFDARIKNQPNSDNYINKEYNQQKGVVEKTISSKYYTELKNWNDDCGKLNSICASFQDSIAINLKILNEINGINLNVEKTNLTSVLQMEKGVYVGKYGIYYSSPPGETYPLNQEQSRANATYIYKYLSDKGWSKNAIIGLIANVQAESSLNPNRYEGDKVRDFSLKKGYGLVQWTPPSKYIDWALKNGYTTDECATLDVQLERIVYEFDNGIQYYPNFYNKYISAIDFKTSQLNSSELAQVFVYNYERPANVEKQAQVRAKYANNWEQFFENSVIGV